LHLHKKPPHRTDQTDPKVAKVGTSADGDAASPTRTHRNRSTITTPDLASNRTLKPKFVTARDVATVADTPVDLPAEYSLLDAAHMLELEDPVRCNIGSLFT